MENNRTQKAIEYFEKCLSDIQENPGCYEEDAYVNTFVALEALKNQLY